MDTQQLLCTQRTTTEKQVQHIFKTLPDAVITKIIKENTITLIERIACDTNFFDQLDLNGAAKKVIKDILKQKIIGYHPIIINYILNVLKITMIIARIQLAKNIRTLFKVDFLNGSNNQKFKWLLTTLDKLEMLFYDITRDEVTLRAHIPQYTGSTVPLPLPTSRIGVDPKETFNRLSTTIFLLRKFTVLGIPQRYHKKIILHLHTKHALQNKTKAIHVLDDILHHHFLLRKYLSSFTSIFKAGTVKHKNKHLDIEYAYDQSPDTNTREYLTFTRIQRSTKSITDSIKTHSDVNKTKHKPNMIDHTKEQSDFIITELTRFIHQLENFNGSKTCKKGVKTIWRCILSLLADLQGNIMFEGFFELPIQDGQELDDYGEIKLTINYLLDVFSLSPATQYGALQIHHKIEHKLIARHDVDFLIDFLRKIKKKITLNVC